MRVAIFLPLLLLGACAGTTVEPVAWSGGTAVDGVRADSEVDGLRYYEGAHFLIVYSDGKGGLKSEVKFLPDLTRKRAIDPYAWFAKNDATLVFTNGILSQSKSVVDETIFPKAAITALEKVATAAIGAFNLAEGKPATYLPLPRIYKIVVGDKGVLTLLAGNTTTADGAAGILVTPQPKAPTP